MRYDGFGMRGTGRRGRRRLGASLAALVLCVGITGGARAEEPAKAAVFDFELIDTSLEGEMRGPQAAEQARLGLISDRLRELLAESGRYLVVDIAPAAAEIEAAGHLHGCNRCEARIARGLGADLAIRGVVQKVSNLILNMTVFVADAETGEYVDGMTVDMRGNTDESWLRGVAYIVRHRLAEEE